MMFISYEWSIYFGWVPVTWTYEVYCLSRVIVFLFFLFFFRRYVHVHSLFLFFVSFDTSWMAFNAHKTHKKQCVLSIGGRHHINADKSQIYRLNCDVLNATCCVIFITNFPCNQHSQSQPSVHLISHCQFLGRE